MNTYRVVQCDGSGANTAESVSLFDTGLSWEEAKARCEALQAAERRAHPERSSWTATLFYAELEITRAELKADAERRRDAAIARVLEDARRRKCGLVVLS